MVRFLISIPKELLDELDAHCEKNHYKRSEWIRFAIRSLIKGEEQKIEK